MTPMAVPSASAIGGFLCDERGFSAVNVTVNLVGALEGGRFQVVGRRGEAGVSGIAIAPTR